MDNDDTPLGLILSRREVLALLGGTALAACAPAAAPSPAATARAIATLTSATPSPAAGTSAASPATIATPSCIVVPALTEGPYFVDEKLQRSDIRTDASGGSPQPGAQFDLAIVVANVSGSACTALQRATVDIWHTNASGQYSDVSDPSFSTKGQKWLRGYQITDASGTAKFTTIYPGWYQGRANHIHFKIRTAVGGRTADFTSQFFFDESMNDKVFATSPYSQRPASQRLLNDRDSIYTQSGGKTKLDVKQSGSIYTATFSIGLAQ